MAKTLVLVLLVAVICSAGYVAVTAAEDFPNDEEMTGVTPRATPTPRADGGTALGGVKGESDLENAPALRGDYNVAPNPEVSLIPEEDIPLADTPEKEEEEGTALDAETAPNTGIEDYSLQMFAAAVLLGGALLAAKRRERQE